jgi:hypothetical protein
MILRSPLFVAVLGLAPLLSCDLEINQCPGQGQTKCDGAQQLWCTECDSDTLFGGQYLCWVPFRPLSCTPDYCVEAEGYAYCSGTSAPVPECARDGVACWEGSPVQCIGGFPIVSAFPACDVDAGETCVNGSCMSITDSGAD